MTNVDIPIPDDLREALSSPPCIDLRLPKPKKLTVMLPSGASLSSIADAGKNIPNDCSLVFSLMLQIMPLMGSMECVLKILKLLKPMSDAITSFPPSPKVIKDVAEATAQLLPCFAMLTPAGMIPFVRDILCLILAVLSCLISQLETLAGFMSGLTVQLEAARGSGNSELAETLECAQENALTAIAHQLNGLGPIEAVMSLAEPFMSIAGVSGIQLPSIGNPESAEALDEVVSTLKQVVGTVQEVVDSIGGCPS